MRLIIILLVVATACHVCKEPLPDTSDDMQETKLIEGYPIDNFKYGDTLIRVKAAENGYLGYRQTPVILIAVQYNNIYVRPFDYEGRLDKELSVLDRSNWCCHWVKYKPIEP